MQERWKGNGEHAQMKRQLKHWNTCCGDAKIARKELYENEKRSHAENSRDCNEVGRNRITKGSQTEQNISQPAPRLHESYHYIFFII